MNVSDFHPLFYLLFWPSTAQIRGVTLLIDSLFRCKSTIGHYQDFQNLDSDSDSKSKIPIVNR